jgi:hypothetical protein
VDYGYSHDEAILDDSQDVRFLTTSMNDNPEGKLNRANLDDLGIRRTIPEAVVPRHHDLLPEQVQFNRIMGRHHILILPDSFFGR